MSRIRAIRAIIIIVKVYFVAYVYFRKKCGKVNLCLLKQLSTLMVLCLQLSYNNDKKCKQNKCLLYQLKCEQIFIRKFLFFYQHICSLIKVCSFYYTSVYLKSLFDYMNIFLFKKFVRYFTHQFVIKICSIIRKFVHI